MARTGCGPRSRIWRRRSPKVLHRPSRVPAGQMLDRIDALTPISPRRRPVEELIAPSPKRSTGWMRSPVGQTAAHLLHRRDRGRHDPVPTAGHLVSWAKFAPGVKEVRRQDQGHRLHRARQPLPRSGTRGGAVAAGRPIPSSVSATAHRPSTWREEADRRGRPVHPGHRLAPAVRSDRPLPTSALASMTPVSTPNAPSATTSASSKPWATRSPSNPPA